ncbi:MAG TPA: sigma-70 family RNA polymerase sigma factor [Gemmataceae bacterium]|nr:sigma-70 family RNA polymerase sigma factor [Gemmataceae bacterium]
MPIDSAAQRLLPHLRRVALARDRQTGDAQLLAEFIASRDEAAFAALVRRHGPMVLGVCRRVIGDPHLAEDAFQATFLVLARRAAAVRPRHLVGHWLYGVAYRTALKARGSALRRMAKEKQVDAMPHPPVSPDQAWTDLQPVLDAELARLPEKYRVPVVLCDLNGRPQRDVARELKLPPATLANRLAAARRLLAKRLTARGVALSGGAVAAALGWHAATSAVPPALVMSTVKAACTAAAGTAVGLPVPVVELSEGVMRMFVLSKLRAVAAGVASCLLLFAGIGLVAGSTLRAGSDDPPAKPPAPAAKADLKPNPKAPEPEDATFLRRTSLDLRGTLPSTIEMHYFLADKDPKKRTKVIEWMLPEHGEQKVSAACQACHVATAPEILNHIPHLNRLFLNRKGAAVGDWDDAWHRELSHIYKPPVTTPDEHAWYVKRVVGLPDEARVEVREADIAIDAAKAEVAKAKVALEIAEQRLKAGPEPEKVRQAEVDRAKAALATAEVHFEYVKRTKDVLLEARRLRLQKAQDDADRVTKDLDQQLRKYWLELRTKTEPSDLEFFRRLSLDVRGTPPTRVEENYFQADQDPKKREKLVQLLLRSATDSPQRAKFIEELLADPEVQKRWTTIWKERLAGEKKAAARKKALEGWVKEAPSDRLRRLLTELLTGKRSDDQVLDALCLATMARFPTETERKLILDGVREQPDRRAAWDGVLRALASTQEAKAHAEGLSKRVAK